MSTNLGKPITLAQEIFVLLEQVLEQGTGSQRGCCRAAQLVPDSYIQETESLIHLLGVLFNICSIFNNLGEVHLLSQNYCHIKSYSSCSVAVSQLFWIVIVALSPRCLSKTSKWRKNWFTTQVEFEWNTECVHLLLVINFL